MSYSDPVVAILPDLASFIGLTIFDDSTLLAQFSIRSS